MINIEYFASKVRRKERWRGFDVVIGVENAMGLGFLLPTEWCPPGGRDSFGAAGFPDFGQNRAGPANRPLQ